MFDNGWRYGRDLLRKNNHIYSWKKVMGWPRYRRRILRRMLDGLPVFPRIEGWLGRGRMVRRMGRLVGSGILFERWTWRWEIVLDSNRDYIEVRYRKEER